MWVRFHDPFVSNLGIAKCLNQYDYPWIIHCTLPFFLYTCISPLYTKCSLSSINVMARMHMTCPWPGNTRMLGVVPNSDDDIWFKLQDAYISTMCITPMHWGIRLVSNMLFSGSSCWSRKAGVLCLLMETMQDMRGNHARQLKVKSNSENSSSPDRSYWDSGKHVQV